MKWLLQLFCSHNWELTIHQPLIESGFKKFKCIKCGKTKISNGFKNATS